MKSPNAQSWYTFGVALFAAMGTFLFGFDTGIVTTTIAHASFQEYMNHPSAGITGAIVSVYIGGEAIGGFTQMILGDRFGRIRFMQFMCIIVTVAVVIQTAAQNVGMLIAGRGIAGVAVGGLVSTVPIYLSEISAPRTRGLIGGLSGLGISTGSMFANWVGFAAGFAPHGQIQWRMPLGLQLPWGIILFIGLSWFVPNSPRHLIRRGDIEGARKAFEQIRNDLQSHEAQAEFVLMKNQIQYEQSVEITSWSEIFRKYLHRSLCSILVNVLTGITGVNVIQYFQTSLYESLGMNRQMVLTLAALWATCGFLANAISLRFLAHRLGRRTYLLIGLAWVAVIDTYSAIMQRQFQHTDNLVGKGFAILGIYLFVVGYFATIQSTTWLYGVEVLPIAIRSKVMGLASAIFFIINTGITQAGPTAFENIGENYYYVFVGCCVVWFGIVYFWFPETKDKTLEEIAAAFGDKVVDVSESDIPSEGPSEGTDKGPAVAHMESFSKDNQDSKV